MTNQNELWANMNLQNYSVVNGRNVWHYLISTSIGNFSIVQYEQTTQEIKRFIFSENYDEAEKKYESIVIGIIKGKV